MHVGCSSAPAQLASRQQLQVQVISAACSLDDTVFQRHPEILFELERQACAAHAEQQDYVAAVQHCRQRLTPLASEHPQFMPALKVCSCSRRWQQQHSACLSLSRLCLHAHLVSLLIIDDAAGGNFQPAV